MNFSRIFCFFCVFFLILMLNGIFSVSAIASGKEFEEKSIGAGIQIGEKYFQVTLFYNASTKALLEYFPLTLTMEDFNGNEKLYSLPSPLPTNSVKVNSIEKGDIMLYGSNTLVVFYDSFPTPYSYTLLGTVDNPDDLPLVLGSGVVKVMWSLSE